jgi:hypothetical protein
MLCILLDSRLVTSSYGNMCKPDFSSGEILGSQRMLTPVCVLYTMRLHIHYFRLIRHFHKVLISFHFKGYVKFNINHLWLLLAKHAYFNGYHSWHSSRN